MPIESFELDAVIPAPPERVYAAWVDPKLHSAFTGSPATVEPWVGGRFTAHDGYIHGINLELSPAKRIVQTWRSSEFPVGTPDSRLAVELSPAEGGGTLLKLLHSNIPHGQGKNYKSGWVSTYFKPLARFFAPKVPAPKVPKAAKAAPAAPEPKPAKAAPPAPKPKLAAAKKVAKVTSPAKAAPAKKASPSAHKAGPKAKPAAKAKPRSAKAPKAKAPAAKAKKKK